MIYIYINNLVYTTCVFLACIPVTFFECLQGAWYDAIKGDLVKAWGEDWGVHPSFAF